MTDIKGSDLFPWVAHEALGGDTLISKESNIYSFGVTVLEVMVIILFVENSLDKYFQCGVLARD